MFQTHTFKHIDVTTHALLLHAGDMSGLGFAQRAVHAPVSGHVLQQARPHAARRHAQPDERAAHKSRAVGDEALLRRRLQVRITSLP